MLPTGEVWIVAGLLACAAEMALPGVFLLPTGLAAVGTGAATLALGLDWTGQVGVFLLLLLLLVGGAALRLRARPRRVDRVNAPDAGLVGQTCRALHFEGGEGRVSLGDGTWAARLAEGEAAPPEPGAALRVVGLDGTVLVVARG